MTRDVLVWWLTAQAFGLAGLPLTRFLFRALPDRGYAFGKALGLLLSGYLAWLLAMLGLAPFGRGLLVICMLAVGAIGFFITKEQRTKSKEHISGKRWQFTIYNLQFSILLILAYEILFALALVYMAFQRSYNYQIIINPNPWGTERPMDYALFNAIRGSTGFPPQDPWLAGYSINYYYFGYLLMAVVSLVSGIAQGTAYNLSLALIFALTALGVAGIIVNLTGLTISDERRHQLDQGDKETRRQGDEGNLRLPVSPSPPLLVSKMVLCQAGAVLLAIVLVLFAGNQGAVLQVVSGTPMVLALEGRDMARAIVNGIGPRQPLVLDPPFKGWDFDGTQIIAPTDRVAEFDWWPPSRAVWDAYPEPDVTNGQRSRRYTITEFPFFSFWLGDMHPHVMALPFGLLALALALQTVARPAAPTFATGQRGWTELVLTGVTLGSLYLINSWDFPTYVLLFLGALLLLYVRLGNANRRPENSELSSVWWRHLGGQAILALLAAWLLFAPFHLTFHSLVGGKAPLIDLPLLATITRTLGVVTSRTPLQNFLIIFGLMLAPLLAYVIAQSRQVMRVSAAPITVMETGSTVESAPEPASSSWREERLGFVAQPLLSSSWRYLPLALLAVLLLGIAVGFPLLVLLALAIYAVRLAIARAERPPAAFTLWAFALVCLVCFGTEIVYIRDVFEGSSSRMNTIFKFYYQAWLIWSVLAAYAVWWLFARWNVQTFKRSNVGRLSLALLAAVFLALLAGALVYPLLTVGKAFREGQQVGIAGISKREESPDDAAAIAWLRTNVPAGSVVLEAAGGDYDTSGLGYGQVSGSTGLPTVLGWPDHERQWRGGDSAAMAQLAPREADVRTIYSAGNLDQSRELLRKYGVDYIYASGAERAAYEQLDPNKLAQLGEPVFQQGNVTIYHVKE